MLYDGSLAGAISKGCILYYHGLDSSKDAWLHDLEIIAERGFLTIGVDNVGHGERRYPDFNARLSQDSPLYWHEFITAVHATAGEVPILVDELMKTGLAAEGKLGILGVSMGGFITYSAILVEPRLTAAVTVVSSPEWWGIRDSRSPHLHPGGFSKIKLLSQTAGNDTIVPNRYTDRFHDKLKSHFADYSSRFAHLDYPMSDHMMDPDWEACWRKTIGWFEHHLAQR